MSKDVLFRLTDIPKEHATDEEMIKFLREQIKKTTRTFNADGKASVENSVRLGSMLNLLKELVNGLKKKSWNPYLKEKVNLGSTNAPPSAA